MIFSADAIDKLPSHCNTIVQWEKDYSGCYNTISKFEEREGVAFDRVSLAEMDVFSRQLSNFKVRENASNAAIPDMLTFLDMYCNNHCNPFPTVQWYCNGTEAYQWHLH